MERREEEEEREKAGQIRGDLVEYKMGIALYGLTCIQLQAVSGARLDYVALLEPREHVSLPWPSLAFSGLSSPPLPSPVLTAGTLCPPCPIPVQSHPLFFGSQR